ncbi:MAG: SRPBCC domain-containing protein, partial [Actinomycetota bacterium]
ITWTFEWGGMPGHVSVETLTLEEHDGKTTLRATSVFDSVEDRNGMLESGMESGAAETYERLDEYLEVLKGRAAG